MGFNTSMLILNDSLHELEKDAEFGKKVALAVQRSHSQGKQDISSGSNARAATVIESHHADHMSIIAFGSNLGKVLSENAGSWKASPDDLLKQLAEKFGYRLVRKSKTKV